MIYIPYVVLATLYFAILFCLDRKNRKLKQRLVDLERKLAEKSDTVKLYEDEIIELKKRNAAQSTVLATIIAATSACLAMTNTQLEVAKIALANLKQARNAEGKFVDKDGNYTPKTKKS
jgi:septal ring factor EnvC (AmiA/AmiB activator)